MAAKLAADGRNVSFHNWTGVVCLDRTTGKKKWETEPVAPRENMGYVYGPTLVAPPGHCPNPIDVEYRPRV